MKIIYQMKKKKNKEKDEIVKNIKKIMKENIKLKCTKKEFNCFGEREFLSNFERENYAICLEDCEFAIADREKLQSLLSKFVFIILN